LHFELLVDGFAGDGNIFRMEDDEIRLLRHLYSEKQIDIKHLRIYFQYFMM
jgi:hypothetical protein